MGLPSWSPNGLKKARKRLKFADSATHPALLQQCHVVEARWISGSSPSGVYLDHVLNTDVELCERIKKPLVSRMSTTSSSHRNWGFRLIISLRDDTYLAEDRPFDLSSSFDLCNFSMMKSTLKAVLCHLGLEQEFIETVASLGDDSKVSFSMEDLDSLRLSYIMRTERALPSDLILAVRSTAGDNQSFTTGFLHGCTEEEAQHIVEWLKQTSQALQEPTLLAYLLAEIQYDRHTHIIHEYWRRYDDLSLELQEKARLLTRPSPFAEDRNHDLPKIPDWLNTIFTMHSKHGRMHRHFCTFQANLHLLQDLAERSSQGRTTPLRPEFQTAASITHRLQQISTGYKGLEQQTLFLKEGASLLLVLFERRSQSVFRETRRTVCLTLGVCLARSRAL